MITTPFSVAVEGELIKSALLIKLRAMPLQQELVLRFGRKVVTTGLVLSQEINKSIVNVEAAHIQVVGTVQIGAARCNHCIRQHGPFAHCVTAPGAAACGNCHWRSQEHRCSFNDLERPVPSSRRYAIPQRVIDKISALKAEAATLLKMIQELKEEYRKTDEYTVETIELNPETSLPASSPEVHEQKMSYYFRLLRFKFLNKIRGRFGQGDSDFAKIEDRAQDLIETIDGLTL